MLDNSQEDCTSRFMLNASQDNSKILDKCVNAFRKELAQDEGDFSFFAASEDEVIEVEHFLVEPKYNGLVDGVLNFDTFNFQKCLNIEGLSAVEYGYVETYNDAPPSSLTPGEKAKTGFLDGKFEGMNDGLSDLPDIYDHLFDTEFDDVCNVNYIPSKESFVENLDLNHQSTGSRVIYCGAENVELSTVSIPMLEATCDQKSSLLDKMTIDELHKTSGNMFGLDTAVTDQQLLKHHMLFGLQNIHVLDNGSTFTECSAISMSNDSGGELVLSTGNECSLSGSNPLSGVFKFKTKPRVRKVKRGKCASYDYLKTFSSGFSKVVIGSSDNREKEGMLVTKKRLGCGKAPVKGACIQVPFGLPVEKVHPKKMDHESETEDNTLSGLNVCSDMDPYSGESQDDMSEDDCIRRTKKRKCKVRRKQHTLWSLAEVLKLVEGVSKYGVGKWTEIKRLLFPSYAHRTSVDLKDKWRNLLRASCKLSHGKGGNDPRRKNAHSIPQHILRRVEELSVIYPYPREQRTKVSPAVSTTSPVSAASTYTNLLHLSPTARV